MLRSWHLGKLFGIDVYVHWTFLLLIVFVMLGQIDGGIPAAVEMGALVVAVFGCVLLHEVGHALMARRFGVPTLDITLYPIGGVARLARLGEKPLEEFWIAVAGPAVNVAIAALLGVLLVLSGRPFAPSLSVQGLFHPSEDAIRALQCSNILLVLFNMLPAFPMDGGRVLRSLLSIDLGRLRATEIAARLGTVFALIFGVVGIFYWHNPILVLIGGFAYIAGQQELAMVRQIEYNRRVPRPDILPAGSEIIDAVSVPIDENFSGVTWDTKTRTWTVWKDGRPVHSRAHDAF
jgi:Zn-dependent protease